MIAEQIEAIHDSGYIHYDLKPSNIVLSEKRVYLLDYGITKQMDHQKQTISVLYNGEGTLQYQSPECFQYKIRRDDFGNEVKYIEIDQKVDIWAYGCIIY